MSLSARLFLRGIISSRLVELLSAIELSGDEQGGSDYILLSGDEQSGGDAIAFEPVNLTYPGASYADKAGATGSGGQQVTGLTERSDTNGDFASDQYIAPTSGDYLAWIGGFESGGQLATTEQQFLVMCGGTARGRSRHYNNTYVHAGCGFAAGIFSAAQGEAITMRQNVGVAESASLGVLRLSEDFSHYFGATRTTAAGVADDYITGFSEQVDVGGNFNTSTGTYTAPETGIYLILASGFPQAASGIATQLKVYVNGVEDTTIQIYNDVDGTQGDTHGSMKLFSLNAGDEVRLIQGADVFEDVFFGAAMAPASRLCFSAYQATVTGSPAVLGSERFDTAGAYNTTTGEFTAPKAGFYLLIFSAVGYRASTGTEMNARLRKNGANTSNGFPRAYVASGATGAYYENLSHAEIIEAKAGDVFDVTVNSGSELRNANFAGLYLGVDTQFISPDDKLLLAADGKNFMVRPT